MECYQARKHGYQYTHDWAPITPPEEILDHENEAMPKTSLQTRIL